MGISQVPQPSTVTSVTGTAGRVTSSGGTTPAIDLATSGVSGGSYGSANAIPTVTVDAYGRITSIGTAAPSAGGYTVIQSGNLTGANITINSIPQNYENLILQLISPQINLNTTSEIIVRANANNSNNYWLRHRISAPSINTASGWLISYGRDPSDGYMYEATTGATPNGFYQLEIYGYSQAQWHPGYFYGADGGSRPYIIMSQVKEAINNMSFNTSSINNAGNWKSGSYRLIGVK